MNRGTLEIKKNDVETIFKLMQILRTDDYMPDDPEHDEVSWRDILALLGYAYRIAVTRFILWLWRLLV